MESVMSTWSNMTAPQQMLVGGLGLLLAYWIISAAVSLVVRWLLAIAAVVVLAVAMGSTFKLTMPDTFCSIRWPAPIDGLCS